MSQAQHTEPITQDHELDVLAQLHQNTGVKQRDLAQAIGLSLGMTNAILKRLAGKGLVTMRKVNARNIHYLVTPDGVEMIARRSYRFLRRTVGHVVRYKERMLEILLAATSDPPAGRGITSVHLVGHTDLEFLVEWCAEKAGLHFSHQTDVDSSAASTKSDAFVIAGEAVPRMKRAEDEPWDLHLAELVIGGPMRNMQ